MKIVGSVLGTLLVVAVPAMGWAQVPLRVATWNVQTVGAPNEIQYGATLDILLRLQPDVIGINEVGSTADIQNLASLAADAGYPYWTVVDESAGGLRNAVLSRLPILSASFETSASLSGDPTANDLSRPILVATVDVPGSPIDLTLAIEHWKSGTTNADELRRAVESIRIAQAVAALDPATDAFIVMGDMNEEADSVPNSPLLFTSLPSGLPLSFSLGADLQALMTSQGISNDPFQYLNAAPQPLLTTLPATQTDGSDATRLASGRRLDYLLASPMLVSGAQAEVYDSADEGLAGLPKYGAPLTASASTDASDHLLVFADLVLPTCGCVVNADCDDGIFCNGQELCSQGVCVGGAPVVCDDGLSCTQDSCDEAAGACTYVDTCSGGPALWINELHYDNASADVAEGVEVAGTAGTDLGGYQLVFYNGNDSAPYATQALSGVLPDQGWGLGVAFFAVSGIQNGAPDGVALVDPNGAVLEFLSYEGVITAASGPAAGMTSVDIGVAEDGATPVGSSLQRQGTGDAASAFTWAGPLTATPGELNVGQTFVRTCSTDLECANGVFCDGAEVCVSGVCAAGAPVVCDDNVACTIDSCDEAIGACEFVETPMCSIQPWMNEVHYDNAGADVDEGVEVAGPAGVDLAGWTILAYNGNGGAVYQTQPLTGVIPNEGAGYGALFFYMPGLQNGAPDGLALVDPQGDVTELLSYEGVLVATDGAAAGITSVDMGVAETPSSPVSETLQRVGTAPGSFVWTVAPQSRGALNAGQL